MVPSSIGPDRNRALPSRGLDTGPSVCSEEKATKIPLFNTVIYSTVALNFQTPGYEMDLNTGRFLINGQCGYVLKPAYLRQLNTTFDPECPGPPRTTLTVQVSRLVQVSTSDQG